MFDYFFISSLNTILYLFSSQNSPKRTIPEKNDVLPTDNKFIRSIRQKCFSTMSNYFTILKMLKFNQKLIQFCIYHFFSLKRQFVSAQITSKIFKMFFYCSIFIFLNAIIRLLPVVL